MKKIIWLFLLISVFGISRAEAGLIGYWNFNEGFGDIASDHSGFGNDATGLESGWTAGRFGYGTNSDNIVVQSDPSLLPSTSLSILAWARIDEFNGLQRRLVEMAPNYGFLFNPPNNLSQTPFILSLNLQSYSFEFQEASAGEWFHAAVSWDGDIAQFYFNGVPATPVAVRTLPH